MTNWHATPPDQAQRQLALDPGRSILVEAPAGSGKTDLLTRRFLRLLSEVEDPARIVAITFTKAAAAEMRQRILSELERAAARQSPTGDDFTMDSLAHRALARSQALGWGLLRMPAQLRISTIDSFCRELALQQPLLSGLGGGLDIAENPSELYRRAARQTLAQIGNAVGSESSLTPAIESLLLWRDNGWKEMENLLVKMLAQRDRWMHEFILARDPDWNLLRERLERPFARVVAVALADLSGMLDSAPGACDEAMELARFACEQSDQTLHVALAELAELPIGVFTNATDLESAFQAYLCLAQLLLTDRGSFRRSLTINHGFPADRKQEKLRFAALIQELENIPGLNLKLDALRRLPPPRYSEENWQIVRACFTMLRHAAGQLQVEFAEAGVLDFAEVAHLAQRVLLGEDQMPSDAAIGFADGIHHLLIDEFQDTSRRQHKLIASLVSAWPDSTGRTIFVVGDPMQSIYFFRDADAELFPRVRIAGLELPEGDVLNLDYAPLTSNFRTEPELVEELNTAFTRIFAVDDGSGVTFSESRPARIVNRDSSPCFELHLAFMPQIVRTAAHSFDAQQRKEEVIRKRQMAHEAQVSEVIAFIQSHGDKVEFARSRNEKYRVAVLGRTRSALAPIALALREASIPFRAVELEQLCDRPEVLDVLALAHALFNAEDRVAWLGVLRAPWCGLSLHDLHLLTSADDPDILRRSIPVLLAERLRLLSKHGRHAAQRVLDAVADFLSFRAREPEISLGTLLKQVWVRLGGAACVDATGRANLELLWTCIDNLPNGEPDLLGPGLDSALQSLTAQPDPAAGSDHGVQLMTIHKSKGLEFEVVIVPELQARCGRSTLGLLSWLERGLASPDESGDITEFLVAPLPSKGASSGNTKTWVDRVYRERESQEMRRILYVAATRARETLHLFARPEYKVASNGTRSLCEPSGSLLSTGWPALADEIQSRFDSWNSTADATVQILPGSAELHTMAASASDNIIVMPVSEKFARLHRLPIDFQSPQVLDRGVANRGGEIAGMGQGLLYERHEGGLLSRALGSAVHSLLEDMARQRLAQEWPSVRSSLGTFAPRIQAQLRASGMAQDQAVKRTSQVIDIALKVARDPIADWMLSPRVDAASEMRWTGVINGTIREVRVDRVFRAGSEPLSDGVSHWWIIDYKTAHTIDLDPSKIVLQFRGQFEPQLKIYAEVLRKLHGAKINICAGLYYPRMLAFDWWEM